MTAADWPLYYYDGDEARGEVNGQGVGDVWWVLGPDGTVVRQTMDTPAPTPVDAGSDGGGGGDDGY